MLRLEHFLPQQNLTRWNSHFHHGTRRSENYVTTTKESWQTHETVLNLLTILFYGHCERWEWDDSNPEMSMGKTWKIDRTNYDYDTTQMRLTHYTIFYFKISFFFFRDLYFSSLENFQNFQSIALCGLYLKVHHL